MASLMGWGVGSKGSPPAKRQTRCPEARSSRTRLRTLTISEKPTAENRRAAGGNGPSVMGGSNDVAPSGPQEKVQDHPDDRKQDDQQRPQDLCRSVRAALQERDERDDVEDQNDQTDKREHEVLLLLGSPGWLDFLRDGLGLREEGEVLAPSGLGICPRHVEAAEGVHADQRARALAVQIQVAAEELPLPALEAPAVARVERARQAVLGVVGDGDSLVEVLHFQHGEHRPEDLFPRETVARLDLVHHRRPDEKAIPRPPPPRPPRSGPRGGRPRRSRGSSLARAR